jgi:hypothetical protein
MFVVERCRSRNVPSANHAVGASARGVTISVVGASAFLYLIKFKTVTKIRIKKIGGKVLFK